MLINSIVTDEVILQNALRYSLANSNDYGLNIICSETRKNVEDLSIIGLFSMIKDINNSIDNIENSDSKFQVVNTLISLEDEYGKRIKSR